jgi:hypothetical protein
MTGPEADHPSDDDANRKDVDGSDDPVLGHTSGYGDTAKLEGGTWRTENEGQDKIGPKRTRNMKYHRDTTGIERPEVFNITRKKTTEPGKIKPKKGSEAHAKLGSNRRRRADIRNNPEMYPGMYKRAAKTGGLPHAKRAHDNEKDKIRKLEKNRAKLEKDFEK